MLPEVACWWWWRGRGYWRMESSGSNDTVGGDSGEARGEDASSLMGNCLALEMPQAEN
jgi:hypothetical protein